MDATQAVSLLVAKQQAEIAMAAAARLMDVNAKAAREMVEMVDRSAAQLEKIAAETARGVGGNLDMSV
jgi:hypothetical protein